MNYFAEGSPETVIDETRAGELLDGLLTQLGRLQRVLLLPPDITRYYSWAGPITCMLHERLKESTHVQIMPAIGTHTPMTPAEIERMFPGVPAEVFRVHDWRGGLVKLGEVPREFIREVSEGKLDLPVPVEIDRLLVEGRWDRIISIGQLVPHEVIGIANHNKNVFIGVGGPGIINQTHYLGAVYGMERIMGRVRTPVRDVLNHIEKNFARDLPITYVLTVRARDQAGQVVTRGIFSGDDQECYLRGAELSRQVNLDLLDHAPKKVVVYLEPEEFKSTWLGNKAIYRTRMAIADDGELIVLAPGVKEFGEDVRIDRLIRKFGYRGTPHTLRMVEENADLRENLSAAAHLIHGSSEGRFRITYCPGHLSREEIEGVGFEYADPAEMITRFDPNRLSDGWNTMPDGEEIFYVSNPGLGLWGVPERFGK